MCRAGPSELTFCCAEVCGCPVLGCGTAFCCGAVCGGCGAACCGATGCSGATCGCAGVCAPAITAAIARKKLANIRVVELFICPHSQVKLACSELFYASFGSLDHFQDVHLPGRRVCTPGRFLG